MVRSVSEVKIIWLRLFRRLVFYGQVLSTM